MSNHNNGRQKVHYGGLDPRLVAMILGVHWDRPGQAADPALFKVGRWLSVDPATCLIALAHRIDHPSLEMSRMMVKSYESLERVPDAVKHLDGYPRVAHQIIAMNELWTPWKTVRKQKLAELDERTRSLELQRKWAVG